MDMLLVLKKNKRCYFAELNKCSEENKENDETSVWHHVDDTKESEDHSIGRMISDGVGIIQLKAELEKCHLAHKSCHDAHHGR